MPRLDSTRHERFARALAEGEMAINAYVAAGYKPNRSAASRLSSDVNILARVNELRGDLFEHSKLDRAWIISRLMRNAEKENGAVSNRALELLGKTMGMFKDDSELPIQNVQPATGNVVRPYFAAMTKKYGA
jgi:phage terminase small subunit